MSALGKHASAAARHAGRSAAKVREPLVGCNENAHG
jgi:hypothetical protein